MSHLCVLRYEFETVGSEPSLGIQYKCFNVLAMNKGFLFIYCREGGDVT